MSVGLHTIRGGTIDKELTQDGAEMNDEAMELTDEELESVTGGLSDMGKR